MQWSQFQTAVAAAGLTAKECSNSHWQIHGGLRIVNVYARTHRGLTFYVQGTASGRRGTLQEAIKAASDPVKIIKNIKRAERKRSYAYYKRVLLRKDPHCKWCKTELVFATATLDHVIPLSRGGSDGMDNTVLACDPCNVRRKNEITAEELRLTQKERGNDPSQGSAQICRSQSEI